MDPTQLQTDTSNDVHSLEGGGTSVGGASADTQPTLSAPAAQLSETPPAESGATPPKPPRQHFWQRFNIYLLLFILLFVVAGGVAGGMLVKSNKVSNSNKNTTVATQSLSPGALKQLANTDVTVGSNQQTLNVASNAVFAGGVLVRSNLEVAGAVAIGGTLSLPGISVSGTSQLGQVSANGLSVSGVASVQGTLTAKNGLNVTGASTFNGSVSAASVVANTLTISGDLALTHHISAGGAIPSLAKGPAVGGGGSASVSGSDTSGTIIINTGTSPPAGCFATLTFAVAFAATPHVVVTPVSSGAAGLNYYINRSTTNMSVCAANAGPASQTFGFDYIVLD